MGSGILTVLPLVTVLQPFYTTAHASRASRVSLSQQESDEKTCLDCCCSCVTGVSDETNIKGFNIPDTIPDFSLGTAFEHSACEVQATPVVLPLNAHRAKSVGGPVPLLIDICWRTFTDLELYTIRVGSTRNL